MEFSLFSPKKRIANLVLNDHSIRFVELKQTNPITVHKWSERFLPPRIISKGKITDFETLANILEECIEEWKIQKQPVRFTVPDPLVIIRKVSVPAEIQEDEIKGYLYVELGSTIHLPFEEPVFDFYPLTKNDKNQEILLFAAPEAEVQQYADLLSNIKLKPIAADISPLALYRLYHHLNLSQKNQILFTLHLELTGVNLCIFDGSIPLVMRYFSLPFNVMQWEIERATSGEVEYKFIGNEEELTLQREEVIKEINMLLDFYRYSLNNAHQEVSKFMVSGDHPMLKQLVEEMKERFENPVQQFSANNEIQSMNGAVPVHLLLALGLGLKGES
ncbi:type IV pilus biogenesis protein PilM [Neobacillus muris]|uniref:type IV pilus biogenesis protein PilM n=1 Tax=Neobacillus muris TaxID=2941334 RepID=UPI00203B21E3|nr:pilus assembly protein PilM [Neobacillus muris]